MALSLTMILPGWLLSIFGISRRVSDGHTPESESCDRGEQGHYRVCQLVRDALREEQLL